MNIPGADKCGSCGCSQAGGATYGGRACQIMTDANGKPLGAQPRTEAGRCSPSEAARHMCWLDETLRAAAIAAGADVTFSLEVKWWWQIQKFVNVGDQTNETFSLTQVAYGQSTYSLTQGALNGSTIDGVAYGAVGGVDIRKWNLDSDHSDYYPLPAMAQQDPVTLVFNNGNAGAQDFSVIAGGPAVLQIG